MEVYGLYKRRHFIIKWLVQIAAKLRTMLPLMVATGKAPSWIFLTSSLSPSLPPFLTPSLLLHLSDDEGVDYQVAYTPGQSPLHMRAPAEPPAAPVKNSKRPREEDAAPEGEPKKKKPRKVVNQADKLHTAVIVARKNESQLQVQEEHIETYYRLTLQLATQGLQNPFHVYKIENPESKMTKAEFEAYITDNPDVLTEFQVKTRQMNCHHHFKNLVLNPGYEIVIHDAQKTFTENEKSKKPEDRRVWKNLSACEKNELEVIQNDTRTWAKGIYRDAAATRLRMMNEGTPLWTVLL